MPTRHRSPHLRSFRCGLLNGDGTAGLPASVDERETSKAIPTALELGITRSRSVMTTTLAATTTPTAGKLRDHILNALSTLPGTREFHIHVLQSSPRKNNSLYPFVTPKVPRAYLQDILVLVSEKKGGPQNEDEPRVLVCAVDVQLYHLATTSSAILYISKVDTTGQGAKPSPTAAVVRALIGYYCSPATRPITAKHVWVQLFARAQGHYLFPNSKEWQGKEWLNDTKLCAWWKRILTRVAGDVENEGVKIKMHYVLPGYSAEEAENTLRIATGTRAAREGPKGAQWEYGHPYGQRDIPLPCPLADDGKDHLGYFIPYFDDDPKSRFLDEIAHTTENGNVQSPQPRKRQKLMVDQPREEVEAAPQDLKDQRAMGDMAKVTVDEFWERMSFRQECVAGAVTGFFSLGVSCKPQTGDCSPLAPQPGQVSSHMNKRILTSLTTGCDFATREQAIKSTETIEKAIQGLCEGMPSAPPERPKTPPPRRFLEPPRTPPRRSVLLPEVSPNPFPEPVTSAETYTDHIYGVRRTANAEESAGSGPVEQHVRVLSVRKKKK